MGSGPKLPASIELVVERDVVLITITGLIDEHFAGFGDLVEPPHSVVIDVSGMVRMTSFGVRQWRRALDALPKSISSLYLLGCPTFFVDQLNMVLNFGGPGEVLTAIAPFVCPGCGVESGELVDVLSDRALLLKGGVPEKACSRCGSRLDLDEAPESYFSFVKKSAAASLEPEVAALLAKHDLYTSVEPADSSDKPPRIIKLVQGSVTYFRIIGAIGASFRARPFLVGAEGEVVIDLAEVERFAPAGVREWRRLLKSLAGQVKWITLVDVGESLIATVPESLELARNISVWSVLVSYRCNDCGRARAESEPLEQITWPYRFAEHVCPICGGATHPTTSTDLLAPLQKVATAGLPESEKLVRRRDEVLSRAMTDANVAQASTASASDDTIAGKYKIVRKLSAGGMAEVFLATQIGIGGFEKPVAVKKIQRKLLEKRHLAIDMFLNEAKIAGRLTHPNIVQVLDVGEAGGELYLAMEYVHGRDLRDIVKQLRRTNATLPLGEACFILREVAQALHHAYWSTDLEGNRLSVVHRDVSPHNVILGYDGTVKLLDFGVAMSAVTEQESMIVGKWNYMSPEATTNQEVDHRSDLFSLGVVMYLLCTGTMPFTGTGLQEIVRKIRAGQYRPLLEHAPELPPSLAVLVGRLLAPNPQDRPQTGLEVMIEINEIMRTHGIETSPADISYLVGTLFPDAHPNDDPLGEISQIWRETSPSMRARTSASFSGQSPLPMPMPMPIRQTPAKIYSVDAWTSHPKSTIDATTVDPPRFDMTPVVPPDFVGELAQTPPPRPPPPPPPPWPQLPPPEPLRMLPMLPAAPPEMPIPNLRAARDKHLLQMIAIVIAMLLVAVLSYYVVSR